MTENSELHRKRKPKIKLLTPKIIYAKTLLIYTIIYTFSFLFGCFIFHSLELKSGQYVSDILTNDFLKNIGSCDNIFDFTSVILDICKSDISHLFIIFMSGFTMITGLICAAIFIFRGFSFGFSVSYLASAVALGELQGENLYYSVFLFSVICAMNTVILLHFAVKTSSFCDEFKSLCGRPKLIIKSKALYKQLFRFLIAFGAILILNLVRCVI